MRIITSRARAASRLGSLGQAPIQESELPVLRNKFARLKSGAKLSEKGSPLFKIGHVNAVSNYYVFDKESLLSDNFVIGVSWNVPAGTDPVRFYPVRTLVSDYELVSPAEEAKIIAQMPIPEFAVKRTSLTIFYGAVTKAYELAEKALSLAESGKFEEARLALVTPMVTRNGQTGAFAERDKAVLELHILEDIGGFTAEEARTVRSSVMNPLLDILNQAGIAIQERKGFFSQMFQSVKGFFKTAAAKIGAINDEKWKNFLAFYKSLTDFDQTVSKNVAELKGTQLTQQGREETQKMEEALLKIRMVKSRIEQVVEKNGIKLSDLRSQAGLGAADGGMTGLIIAAVVFTIVGAILSHMIEPLIAFIKDLMFGREWRVKAYQEELRIQEEAQAGLEKEQAGKRQEQLKAEDGKIREMQQKGRNLIDSLSNLTGEKVTLEKLEQAKKLTPVDTAKPGGLSTLQWTLLAATGGILAAYFVSTRMAGKKEE